MQLLLDSAVKEEAQTASQWRWVSGVTTNPTLLAKSNFPPEKTLKILLECFDGPIFYQLVEKTIQSMMVEADLAFDILGKQLVLKIPATKLGFIATHQLSKKFPCAVTSIFTASQALVAHASGARYALYYHNRAKRLMKNGKHLANELVQTLEGSNTIVVAASLKSPEEVIEARLAGVQILSTKFNVLSEMMQNDLSESAIKEFDETGVGLKSK